MSPPARRTAYILHAHHQASSRSERNRQASSRSERNRQASSRSERARAASGTSRSERNRRALPGPNSRPRHHPSFPDSAHLRGTANAAPRLSRPSAHTFLAILLALVPPLQAPECITMTAKCLPSASHGPTGFHTDTPPATQIGRVAAGSYGTRLPRGNARSFPSPPARLSRSDDETPQSRWP